MIFSAVLISSFTGCTQRTVDFDVSGYIEALLNSTYKSENELYVGFTQTTTAEAATNNATTVSNAVVRFFSKYGMNPSENQSTALAGVFVNAYKLSQYTVMDKVKTETGYTVDVNYTPLKNISAISSQIEQIKTNAGEAAYDVGAAYIDNVVELCSNVLEVPEYGDSVTKKIDILLASNGELSLNIKLFNQIDEEILPF